MNRPSIKLKNMIARTTPMNKTKTRLTQTIRNRGQEQTRKHTTPAITFQDKKSASSINYRARNSD
jgi:hypothetical protein